MIFFSYEDKRNCTLKNSATGTLLFADDQVIISTTEDNMQKVVYKSNQIITESDSIISAENTKISNWYAVIY